MNTSSLSPHSCAECKVVVIDGTGPEVKQHFEFPCYKVQELSQRCKFFSWTLKLLSDIPLYTTDTLILSMLTDSEDLECLNIDWRDANNQRLSEDDIALYIFSEKGKLSVGTCYAHG